MEMKRIRKRILAGIVVFTVLAPSVLVSAKEPAPVDLAVSLNDGMFKESQDIGEDYLLSYDVDRLAVSLFRHSSKKNEAPVDLNNGYGGWEDSGPNGIGGHVYGHYMSACIAMYMQTGNEALKERVERGVELVGAAQDEDGFVAGFGRENLDYVFAHPNDFWSGGNNDAYLQGIWAPWYTIHKILAGLIEAYEYLDIKEALTYAEKIASYAKTGTDKLNDQQVEKMLIGEHGGINESFAQLYEITGKQEYIELAKRFSHKKVMDPLARGEDNLTGLHANTQIPKICGAAKIYMLTGDDYYKNVAENFWKFVEDHQTYANGGTSNYEFFTGAEEEPLSDKTAETCCVYNMLKLTEYLYSWNQKAEYMDYYENVLYNQILGSQNEQGQKTYSVDLRIGGATEFLDGNGFECCMGTGMENPGRYTRMIYYQDTDRLFVNLFINSTVDWKEKGMKITQSTQYPNEDKTTLTVDQADHVETTIKVRVPEWTKDIRITVNGKEIAGKPENGYVSMTRKWNTGDKIEITMPMSLNLYVSRGDKNVVAFKYGAVLLAGDLGTDKVRAIVSDSRNPEDFIEKKEGSKLAFEMHHILEPGSKSMQLKPFYEFQSERRMVYWNLYTQEEYETAGSVKNFEDRLDDVTKDSVVPGWMQSELDHHYQTEGFTETGNYAPAAQAPANGSWRSVKGGSISYDLKVDPDHTNYVLSMFWGSDDASSGPRVFDILVNDTVLQKDYVLNNNRPNRIEFFYLRIPASLTKGKDKVTVKYFAKEGNKAGGIFGVRTTTDAVGDIEWSKTVDSESADVVKTGNWKQYETNAAFGNVETYTDEKGAAAEYDFTGYDAVQIGGKADSSKSGAEVYIDGTKKATVKTGASESSYKVIWNAAGLEKSQTHKLKLVTTGAFGFDYIQLGNEMIKIGNLDEKAEHVIKLINAIGDPVTEEEVRKAREAYDLLNEAQKDLVTNYDRLVEAERQLAEPEERVTDIFHDIQEEDWFVEAVQYVYDHKIMTGLTKDTFGPGAVLSRAQFATILYRIAGKPETSSRLNFPDTEPGAFYEKAVAWASSSDVRIINGYADGRFGPSDELTREQMVVLLYRYLIWQKAENIQLGDYSDFPDADLVSEFADEAVKWAVENKIITGDNGNISPQGKSSRAQCATVIMRFLD